MRFVVLTVLLAAAAAGAARPPVEIAPGVTVVEGAVNGVLIRAGGKVLAVCGDSRPEPPRADRVLFADHRRDTAWAGERLARQGAEAFVPAAELPLFTGVRAFWERYRTARFHDYACQTSKVLAEPLTAATPVRGGEQIRWEGPAIEVLDTPGFTRGAVSYLFEAGDKRIACPGNLIYGDGRILDLYSLQDAIPEAKEDAYHGWAARAADVLTSLRKIAAWKPDILVPARGPVIHNPQAAIATLERRLKAVFASHFEIDALRWYRGDDRLRIQASRVLGSTPVDWMPKAETRDLPAWVIAIDNARLIVSSAGGAFLVDCGSRKILEEVKRLRSEGRFKTVDGIFVTHYHDDHTNMVQAAADEFHAPVYAAAEMRDILERPDAFRMPAQTPNAIRPVTATRDGQVRRWNEFQFTWRFLPGQTLYHGALLVKKDAGESVFFIGDSFTPTGIDDYCLLNRNFLGALPGLSSSVDVLRKTCPDCLLVNQHVAPAFRFSAAALDRMARNLEARKRLLLDLLPFDDPNFGLDEQWARFYPYSLETAAGQPFKLQVVILNHSPVERRYTVAPRVPAGWKTPGAVAVTVPARAERTATVRIAPPPDERGVRLVTADIAFGDHDLREWAEALVVLR
ncbi:MAG TPA: MBL fold metallo-hydrolase [Bryobacteraceae bacterium]|nr:MBL fold metallo-hydrolase [Bryobacteraceae bacterium]